MRAALLLTVMLMCTAPARGAELAGVTLPEAVELEGVPLRLNGIAARRYSVLRVTVYVAGLYLEQPSGDAGTILRSPGRKLVEVRYLRSVGPDDVRRAWRALLDANCPAPCPVPPASIERFLALSPAVRAGSRFAYALTPAGVTVLEDGQVLGQVPGAEFGRLLLATFIGAEPTSPEVRAGLLGMR